jgi:PhzF family phenazine biosynthesis protein
MQPRPYIEVDVFGARPYLGNPLAVVVDARGLDPPQMQRFARWTNLSETTFLMPPTHPEADYQVRIFTPNRELPFAGHPTLGSCHAWLTQGGQPRLATQIVQQCALGLVRLRRDGERLAFCAPPMQAAPIDEGALIPFLDALGLSRQAVRKAQWLNNGPLWLGLLVDGAQTVLSLQPDHAALQPLGLVGVIGPREAPKAIGSAEPGDFEVRAFASAAGVPEDPVTGSLNAALAQWLIAEGVAPPCYVVSQGARLQRNGKLYIELREGDVWVGGGCATCVQGTVQL